MEYKSVKCKKCGKTYNTKFSERVVCVQCFNKEGDEY